MILLLTQKTLRQKNIWKTYYKKKGIFWLVDVGMLMKKEIVFIFLKQMTKHMKFAYLMMMVKNSLTLLSHWIQEEIRKK